MFDNCQTRSATSDACVLCSTSGYILSGTSCIFINNCVLSNGLTSCSTC